jgi:hypothetical protein
MSTWPPWTWALGPATDDIAISGDGLSTVVFLIMDRVMPGHFWDGILGAAFGQPLTVATYVGGPEIDLTRPTIDIAAWGTGCGTSGTFTVEAIEWLPDRRLRTFVAGFEQRCVGALGALRGRLEYHVG